MPDERRNGDALIFFLDEPEYWGDDFYEDDSAAQEVSADERTAWQMEEADERAEDDEDSHGVPDPDCECEECKEARGEPIGLRTPRFSNCAVVDTPIVDDVSGGGRQPWKSWKFNRRTKWRMKMPSHRHFGFIRFRREYAYAIP